MTKRQRDLPSRTGPLATVTKGVGTLLTLPPAIAVGWIVYSALAIDHQAPLPPAIDAERKTFYGDRAGWLNVYHDRQAQGRPLILIHSVNAAASAFEMGPLFSRYRGRRPVYALDLPGFGLSERSDRVYAPDLFEAAILETLAAHADQPADVVALSLGCEFAARAALTQPERVHSLTLISPSGFNQGGLGRSSQRASEQGASDRVYRYLAHPLWGRALYDLIATRRSIEFFLQQSFEGPVPPGFVDYAYATSHQPGAHYAPLRFISGLLFTREIRERVYERLSMPVMVIHDRDAFSRFDTLPAVVEQHANWRAVRVQPTGGLPHFEKLEATALALDEFWASLG